LRQNDRVQRIGVGGAENVVDEQACGLGVAGHPPHKSGLSATRAAFQDVQCGHSVGVGQFIVKRIESGGRIGPQKITGLQHFSVPPLAFNTIQPMLDTKNGADANTDLQLQVGVVSCYWELTV